MYEILKDGQVTLRTDDKQVIASFFHGVMSAGGEPVDYDLTLDGKLTIKTFIINEMITK
jgi:hypothetical protein